MRTSKRRRTEAEIRKLVSGYENGNQSRAAYCAAHGLPLTTLDYYRRRFRPAKATLVEIDLRDTSMPSAMPRVGAGAVAVVLRNGRRVEIEWADLGRVAGHSEPLRALVEWMERT